MTTEDLITVREAGTRYKLTPYKMSDLIRRKVIRTWDNPRDARSKYVKAAEVEAYVNAITLVEVGEPHR